jgi:hypothetical protein
VPLDPAGWPEGALTADCVEKLIATAFDGQEADFRQSFYF